MQKGLPGDRLRLVTGSYREEADFMLYAGLDLSRKRLDFHLLDGEGATLDVGASPPDADGLRGLSERLARHGAPIHATIESMNGARFVHDRLELHGWQVEIADAQKVKGLAPLACKTDRIDAWVLAELARRDLVPAIWLPDPRVRAERERARWRLHLVRHRSSLKQRVHAVLLTHGTPCPVSDLFGVRGRQLLARLGLPEPWQGTIEASLRLIDELDHEIGECERELRQLGDISRFPSAEKLAGYTGLCPRVYQSGEADRRGSLSKQGPRYLRWISWMGPPAAAVASRPRQLRIDEGGPSEMVYAAIDIHKRIFQAAVLDAETGELVQERLPATREALNDWATRWQGKLEAVALEATTGWRWVARALQGRGVDVRLCDPGEARALGGSKRRPKTDRLDAAWLARLLAKEMLPEAWLPPEEIQYLRDRTRLRHALAKDRNRWAQRLHALLTHEGWPCGRGRLLTVSGQRWASALALPAPARASVEAMLAIIRALDHQIELLDRELRQLARSDPRLQALCAIFGVGPVLAAHILAELGDVTRFRRARQVVRLSGLDPVVSESADVRRRGRLSKQGSPELRWALTEAAHHACQPRSPDHDLYLEV